MHPSRGRGALFVVALLLSATGVRAAPGDAVTFVKKLLPDADAAGDQFGQSVAIEGDRIAVGAYLDDDKGQSAGAVYIFERNRGGAEAWGLVKKIVAPNGAAGDNFGWGLALSHGRLAVGAGLRAGAAGRWRGSVYLFEADAGGKDNWGLVKEVIPDVNAVEERFGFDLVLDDDLLAVGALGHREAGVVVGAAYLFRKDNGGDGNWGLVQLVKPDVPIADSDFGAAVALRGQQLMVGARAANARSGVAYLFVADGATREHWSQLKKWVGNGAADDFFGWAVAVGEGDLVAVGASGEAASAPYSGTVYLFGRDQGGANSWGQVKRLVPDATGYQYFGETLAFQGPLLLVSAVWDNPNGAQSGSASLFARDEGGANNWGRVKKFTAPDNAADDWFGRGGAISGATLVIGTSFDDDHGMDSGAANVFKIQVGTGCAGSPCLNGGSCDAVGGTSVLCTCAAGFAGDLCQTNVDDCAPNPCHNGGACTDGINSFTCQCPAGYRGLLCDDDVDECAGTPAPCDPNAVCTNMPGSFQCSCKAGFMGDGAHCQPIPVPDAGPDAGLAGDAAADVLPATADAGAGADVTGDTALVDVVEARADGGSPDLTAPQAAEVATAPDVTDSGALADAGDLPADASAGPAPGPDTASAADGASTTSLATGGCACDTGGRGAAGGWSLLALALAVLVRVRRRRRST